jgi:Secretion system C-terminal sorting domain
MKIITIIIALCPLYALAQNSFPNAATNPLWHIEMGNFFGAPQVADFSLGNNVEIEGKIYQEIKSTSTQDPQPVLNGYVRNENKKVYIRTFDPWNRGNLSKEKLMYDFSLEVNKKIYCAAFSLENPADSTLCWAVSTDSMVFRGVKRKVWNMRYFESTGISDPPNRNVPETWIEGIGSTAHPFFPLYCISEGCEAYSAIVCMHESNVLKFLSPRYSSCDSLITTSSQEAIYGNDIKLYPKLASHQLTVENKNFNNLNLQITNSLGQIFITKQLAIGTNSIDVTALASGFYFALISDGHKRRVEKFVKN